MAIGRAEASSVQKENLRADGQAVGRGRSTHVERWRRRAMVLSSSLGAGGGQQFLAPWWVRTLMGWSLMAEDQVVAPGTEMVTWKVASTDQCQSSGRMVAAVRGQTTTSPT